MPDAIENVEERFFANHKFQDGIGIAEYQLAAQKLDGEERAFTWSTNIISLIAPAIWFAGYRIYSELEQRGAPIEFIERIISVFLVFSIIFSAMAIIHIVRLIKNKVMAERKIILLRRSMGVAYGSNSMVLPSWRIEGADNPFSMRLFPGYFSYSSFPIFIILSFPALSIIFLFNQSSLSGIGVIFPDYFVVDYWLAAAWVLIGSFLFRWNLREQNENIRLTIARLFSLILSIPVYNNIEYILYRCKLEVIEAKRLGADFSNISKLAILIEDREFFKHSGINLRGILRAAKQYISRGKVSGGSSITQQVARTNFLLKLRPAFRRKLVEVAVSFWIESVLRKKDILELYLVSARFDQGVFGFHRAARHFFGETAQDMPVEKSFVLIERLGNIRGLFLGNRVHAILDRLVQEGEICLEQAFRILDIYQSLLSQSKISGTEGASIQEIRDGLAQRHARS